MDKKMISGHISALVSTIIWGTTFISTKFLLEDFTPVEILFIRFLAGLAALTVACPKRLKVTDRKQEIVFAAAGLSGVCLYYLLENTALTFSMASNVGVIVSSAPFFTAILSRIFMKGDEKFGAGFFIGFAAAIAGICLISFGGAGPEFSPVGDILALAAALAWAVYSLLLKKISGWGYNTIQTTRRTFFYGVIFMLPALPVFGFSTELSRFAKPVNALNLLYLGLGASALCFVIWGIAVRSLGTVKTSVYIYLVPVVTVIASAVMLGEPVTPFSAAGTALTLAGLFISESGKFNFVKRGKKKQSVEKLHIKKK